MNTTAEMSNRIADNHSVSAVLRICALLCSSVVAFLFLAHPQSAAAWAGDTWANITRATIQSNANLMIDSTWVPKNSFTNWQYSGSTQVYQKGTVYTGVAYSQTYYISGMVQENWKDFITSVTNTAGGTVAYGNDCSGFVSICWKLPTREVTSTFESKLGGTAKWFSVGDIGTAATAKLVMGDALNSSSVGHIVLFLNYETTGVRTMEQTPDNAQRKVRSYSNVAEYRPIRRMQVLEDKTIFLGGSMAFGTVILGNSAQRTLTISNTGTNTLTVTSLTLPAGFSGAWSGTIAAGGSKSLSVTFSPTSVGAYGGTLSVASDATVGTNTITLSGTGSALAPQILAQPQSQSVVAGQNATLTVSALGQDPLAYQWRFNGDNLAGATTSTFTRTGAQYAHSGNYSVTVSNSYGMITSQVALLTVTLPPVTQTLWQDNFDSNTAGNWVVNRSSTDCRIAFNYDYSVYGVPSAPNSGNGTTRGAKFEANVSQGVSAAINASPAGQNFGGDFRLRFDLWMNQNGPFPAGGTGSTQHGTAGIGTAGNRVQWMNAGSTSDGYWFAADGEGQASDTSTTAMNDYGAFSGTNYYAAASGVYAAGTASNSRGNGNSYYTAVFPGGQTAPASQSQSGSLSAGTIGFAWRDVIISKSGSTIDWSINGVRIATLTGASLTSSNIFIGLWDYFASLSDNTNLSFALFDNVRVERTVTNVPPYLTSQPVDRVVGQGSNSAFAVTAGGTGPLSYQWRCNGTNLAGATSSACTVSNTLPKDAGSYTLVVTNSYGSVTSSVATLAVTVPVPADPGQFNSVSRLSNGGIQLNMSGTAGTNYVLQWTTDWLTWSNLCTLSATNGQFLVVDPCTNSSQRFFRLRVGP